MEGLALVCPNWREDGPWGKWAELVHYRVQISLPMGVRDLLKFKLDKCQCGKALVLMEEAHDS